MSKPMLTLSDIRALVRAHVERCGSYRRAASELGIHFSYLSNFLHDSTRRPGPVMLAALQLQEHVSYSKK
jgi:hypothetical protein